MSNQEKKSAGGAGSSIVVVDQTAVSRQSSKQPFRPINMQEDATQELHHKHSKAPAVPNLAEKHSNLSVQKISSSKEKLENLETIALVPLPAESKHTVKPSSQPIPAQIEVPFKGSDLAIDIVEKKEEDDSITEEIAELRTTNVVKESSEWSDEEEASGLPRSESRASRVIYAMRQLFCCGVQMEPPSEHDISPRNSYGGI